MGSKNQLEEDNFDQLTDDQSADIGYRAIRQERNEWQQFLKGFPVTDRVIDKESH